jgi:metal-responsive CopG/Arc/MetJ family transcriptional regulator
MNVKVEREKITTTLDKELLKKVKKKMIDKEIKNLNEVIEELLRKWV